jgi:hypothetical protein
VSEKDKRMAYIFYSGYATHYDWTLEEWFEAKEYIQKHKTRILKLMNIK